MIYIHCFCNCHIQNKISCLTAYSYYTCILLARFLTLTWSTNVWFYYIYMPLTSHDFYNLLEFDALYRKRQLPYSIVTVEICFIFNKPISTRLRATWFYSLQNQFTLFIVWLQASQLWFWLFFGRFFYWLCLPVNCRHIF